MTKNMKRFAAFVLCLAMVLGCVPAFADEGQAITSGIGLGGLGIILEEEVVPGVTPAGPVLGSQVSLELTIGAPKTYSMYGYDWTNVPGFFDKRPDMKVTVINKVAVPDVFVNNSQIYLYDFTLEAGDLYLDYVYPSNVALYDGTTARDAGGCTWTLKVIANTAPANLVPKGQLLNSQTETITAAIGETKTISFYGFSYTEPATFFNESTVQITNVEKFAVPGAYANGSHPVYLYNVTLQVNDAYNVWNNGLLYTSNIVFYNGTPEISYYQDWKLILGEGEATETPVEAEPEAEEIDLSNVQLLISSNLDSMDRIKLGTEMVLTAELVNAEGLDMVIWWQQSTDGGQTWTDIPGSTGSQYKEIITRENLDMQWRASADLVQNLIAD